jgi:DNA (cytosine-5)-methyltransferase 1
LSLGLQEAGFTVRAAFDLNPKAIETHKKNLGGVAFVADASKLSGAELLERAGMSAGELDVFAGGPPCQGFSKQKRGAHLGDARNSLVGDYIRLVDELRPRAFIFENVAIFGQKRGRDYVEQMFSTLSEYCLTPHFYNTADYGLAQTRKRFVVVGVRLDVIGRFRVPQATSSAWATVGQVLKGLPEPPLDFTHHPDFPNHQRARVTPINIERFSYVPQGGGWRDIPEHLRLPCHRAADPSKGGWPDVYGRLELDGQCPTITGGFDSFTRGRFGHPLQNRPLTPREAARLQGFPDHYRFVGTRGDVRSQIGNAVPPPLAAAIAGELKSTLFQLSQGSTSNDTDPTKQLVIAGVSG